MSSLAASRPDPSGDPWWPEFAPVRRLGRLRAVPALTDDAPAVRTLGATGPHDDAAGPLDGKGPDDGPTSERHRSSPLARVGDVGAGPADEKVVLVVDDVEPLRRLASAALERAGYRVVLAADGHEAIEIAEHTPFDLVLTDIVMPGMSGRELTDHLLAARPDLPVVYMTGYTGGMLELADHADSLGAEILTKPFAVAELLDCVERQLARNP